MLAAVLTTFCFALSGVTGEKTATRLGGLWGNAVRLFLAAVVLGVIVLLLDRDSLRGPSFLWFLLSGAVGFGLGDIALFLAYERLGSRLTILLNLCLAPLFAMATEWIWLGNAVTGRVFLSSLVILAGVTLALRPGARVRQRLDRRGKFWIGVVAAITAGFGQGTGAVISRKAEEVAALTGVDITGVGAAFQRVLAGLIVGVIAVAVVRAWGNRSLWRDWRSPLDISIAPWLLGAALFGPVIGVSCFQWALQSRESGVVLAVVATTPIVMMPMAAITEGDHPTRLAVLGAVIAVGEVILINLWA